MDSAVAALWTLVAALVTFLVTAAATLGPLLIQRQRVKLEQDIEALKQRASDKAVLAVEDQTRGERVAGVDKVMMAQRMADAATHKSITIDSADVRAAVTRMKASMPSPSLPPLSIPVHVVSSNPPDFGDIERPTLPRPAPLPRDPSREKAPLR